MKKVVTRPDGTKEEIEGTAEEIAEYERKIRNESAGLPAPDERRVLNEDLRQELKRMVDEAVAAAPKHCWHFCGCQCGSTYRPIGPVWISDPRTLPIYDVDQGIGQTAGNPFIGLSVTQQFTAES